MSELLVEPYPNALTFKQVSDQLDKLEWGFRKANKDDQAETIVNINVLANQRFNSSQENLRNPNRKLGPETQHYYAPGYGYYFVENGTPERLSQLQKTDRRHKYEGVPYAVFDDDGKLLDLEGDSDSVAIYSTTYGVRAENKA